MNSEPTLSFVIPAFNEAEHIGDVIRSIRTHVGVRFTHEIIVVDNGSSDDTVAIARALGADVLSHPKVTVAALRNAGAARARAGVYVFLDGDVVLTAQWVEHLPAVLATLPQDGNIVTGSRCGISRTGNWIEEIWFKPLLAEQPNYINSGHLITTRALFNRLDGFNSHLDTGEDSDFSRRAREQGAAIVNNPRLEVIHEGYPKTLRRFVRREMWHGKGNFQSLKLLTQSKIGPVTVVFLSLHAGILATVVAGNGIVAIAMAFAIAALCGFAAWSKYRRPLKIVLTNSYLYYWYFVGRSLALLGVLATRFTAVLAPLGRRAAK